MKNQKKKRIKWDLKFAIRSAASRFSWQICTKYLLPRSNNTYMIWKKFMYHLF